MHRARAASFKKKMTKTNQPTPHTLAAADLKFVELGALIILGLATPDVVPVRYTIPAPILGFLFAGVTGLPGDAETAAAGTYGSLSADERASLDTEDDTEDATADDGKPARLPEAVRPRSVCAE